MRDGATLSTADTCRRAGIGHRTIDDVIQPNRVLELHAAGATMVLQGLQLSDPHLARLANNLALDLGHAVQINAYLSPAAAKGLELHFDFHDVFVLQLDGRKRWRVWEPLDRTRHPVRTGPKEPMPTFDELGPAGARPDAAGRRLPVPAARVPARRRDGRCGVVAPDDRCHGAGVAPGRAPRRRRGGRRPRRHAAPSVPADLAGTPSLDDLAPHLAPAALQRWLARETWRRQPATRLRPRHPSTVDLTTPLAVTPGPLLWLCPIGDRVELGLGDRALTMPAEAGALLAAVLAATSPFTLEDLDDSLDVSSRLVVGQRLVVEGVVAAA